MRRKPHNHFPLNECERSFSALISSFLKNNDVDRWVIAHSGGLDSQLLLHLAAKHLADRELLVVHVNHQLHPKSGAWAEFSQREAERLGLSHKVSCVVPESSSEAHARDARYAAFTSLLRENDCLLMGHHADDQAETILFRMIRGSGIRGLQGMPFSRQFAQGQLLRPLLNLERSELEGAVQNLGLAYIDDPSNSLDHYDRNYLRHHVLPRIKERWGSVTQRFQQNAQLLSQTELLLKHYLQADLDSCSEGDDCLDIRAWLSLPDIRQPELLRFWVALRTGVTLNQKQVSSISSDLIMAQDDATPVFKRKGVEIRRFQNQLYLVPEVVGNMSDIDLGLSDELNLGDGLLSVTGKIPSEKWVNAVVKRRKGGERCRPVGKSGTVTVKKLLQEASIPPWQREHWPLIFIGEELVAVPGVCLCQGFDAEKSGFSLLWRPFSLSDNS
ncbi:tRNA lysidine(34) synthetase TilS [Neptuniibacter caesariensis]|uniref:tRNA(Ile)-lysidine synthase n=1 Tax=Neptuniibacter caesariensis TaxID=207954 RepID=A0A7U8GSZ5_NEPCE|nr:tRNA lysidine(34) synthetase TilS [Neptuniibacter caesariensis]EAR63057.1 mesJ protein [Oceanospirillum sp. MED92] [Neptuniibacter caesariensis]